MNAAKYTPECFTSGNTQLYQYGKIDIDRVNNFWQLTIQVYRDKKGKQKEQILFVKMIDF